MPFECQIHKKKNTILFSLALRNNNIYIIELVYGTLVISKINSTSLMLFIF